jgi:hypothetical protein
MLVCDPSEASAFIIIGQLQFQFFLRFTVLKATFIFSTILLSALGRGCGFVRGFACAGLVLSDAIGMPGHVQKVLGEKENLRDRKRGTIC